MTKKQKQNILNRVEESLNILRPFLEADGGNMEVVGLTDDLILQLRLTGNCADCSMSEMTMKAGVEEAIKRAVPEIIKVEATSIVG